MHGVSPPVPRTLPLFPLSLVLFPGATIPLHIFEPRYREMLADCMEGERRFGLIFLPDGVAELELPPGHVGCVAHIEQVKRFADGRANILVTGESRFALEHFRETDHPYHVADLLPVEDVAEPADALAAPARVLQASFERVARAARELTDDRAPIPDVGEDPSMLAFRVASLIDLDRTTRQRILASRSASERLHELEAILSSAAPSLEQRAAAHQRAKQNGHGRAGGAPGLAS